MSTRMSISHCCKSRNHKNVMIKIIVIDYSCECLQITGRSTALGRVSRLLLGLWAGRLLCAPAEKLAAQHTNEGTGGQSYTTILRGRCPGQAAIPSASLQWLKRIAWCWETDSTSSVRGATKAGDSGYGHRDPSRIKVMDAIDCNSQRQKFSQLQKSSAGIQKSIMITWREQ